MAHAKNLSVKEKYKYNNTNADGCLKWVYNIIISIDRCPVSNRNRIVDFFELTANIVSLGMRIDIES